MRRDSCVGVAGENDSSNLKIRPVLVGIADSELTGKRATDRFAILMMSCSMLDARLLDR